MAFVSLTKSEEKLMQFLWNQEKPLNVTEMLELLDDRAWTKNYTRDIVRELRKKRVVDSCGRAHSGRNYAQRFQAVMSREDYYAQLARHNGVTVSKMLQAEAFALVKKGDKKEMEELIQELEDIIEEYRARDDEEE